MSDTKKSNTKNQPPAREEIAKDKTSSQEVPEQETIETPQVPVEIEKEKGLLGEVVENIGEDATMVGEKAPEIAEMIVDKLKKGFSQAYEAGAKVVDELSQTAQDYADKYKAESEIKKLNGKKDLLITQLGHSILKRYLAEGKVTESFFNEKEITDQFNQIEMFDKQIINTGKQLDKAKV
jgi:hypothetical protein